VLQASRIGVEGGYTVAWRKEPDGKDRIEFGF
jgi:hypothetical protein